MRRTAWLLNASTIVANLSTAAAAVYWISRNQRSPSRQSSGGAESAGRGFRADSTQPEIAPVEDRHEAQVTSPPLEIYHFLGVERKATPLGAKADNVVGQEQTKSIPQSTAEAALMIQQGSTLDLGGVASAVVDALLAIRAQDRVAAEDRVQTALGGRVALSELLMLGGAASNAGFGDMAARIYLHASKQYPDDQRPRRELVVCLSLFDRDSVALPFARELVNESPGNVDYVELLAQVLQTVDCKEAMQLVEGSREQFPSSVWLFQSWMHCAVQNGVDVERMKEFANRYIDRIAEQAPQSLGMAYGVYANSLAKSNHLTDALAFFEKAIEAGHSNALARGNYAVALASIGRQRDAAREFQRALSDAEDLHDFESVKRQYLVYLLNNGMVGEAEDVRNRRFSRP
jgi:tetratricopeptide (TPR) repeat protein